MNKLYLLIISVLLLSCTQNSKNTSEGNSNEDSGIKIPAYAWLSGPGAATDAQIDSAFTALKSKGIIGLMYNGGHDPETYHRVGAIAKKAGLEFYAWIPTMVQQPGPDIDPEWYGINGKGESAYDKPAYTSYYHFLCPSKPQVYSYLENLYSRVADVPEVDGIHLDYIRFPDVILAKGLWAKYGLVMDREYPQFDYCYCDDCVKGFKAKTGIDIRKEKDPSQVQEWKQYRYDLITGIVNRLADMVHAKGKQINAAVFPGPNSVAKKIVRQEWDRWNLDAFYPMNYNDFYLEDTKWIGAVCKEGVTAINNRKPLYSGLFICPDPAKKSSEPDPENHGLVPGELEDAIRESVQNGAAGICLFTPNRMTAEDWMVFESAIRKDYTIKE